MRIGMELTIGVMVVNGKIWLVYMGIVRGGLWIVLCM